MKTEDERQSDLEDLREHEDRWEEDMKIVASSSRNLNFWWADKQIDFANGLGKSTLLSELEFPEHARPHYRGLSEDTKNRLMSHSRQDIAAIYSLSVSTLREVRATRIFLRVVFGVALVSLALNGWLAYELAL